MRYCWKSASSYSATLWSHSVCSPGVAWVIVWRLKVLQMLPCQIGYIGRVTTGAGCISMTRQDIVLSFLREQLLGIALQSTKKIPAGVLRAHTPYLDSIITSTGTQVAKQTTIHNQTIRNLKYNRPTYEDTFHFVVNDAFKHDRRLLVSCVLVLQAPALLPINRRFSVFNAQLLYYSATSFTSKIKSFSFL